MEIALYRPSCPRFSQISWCIIAFYICTLFSLQQILLLIFHIHHYEGQVEPWRTLFPAVSDAYRERIGSYSQRDDSPPGGFAATTNMMKGTIQIFTS